jgi:uncharacterized protein (DUF1330 family)
MAKGCWIAHVDVDDPEGCKAYFAANEEPFATYGARFLVRSGRSRQKEGALRGRHVAIECKDYATALACYESPEYQRALAIRQRASRSDLAIIEGYDGIQPA